MNSENIHHVNRRLKQSVEAAEAARDVLESAGQTAMAAKLSDAIETAKRARVSIGVVGIAKRGKSTLINGLLGRKDDMLAPVDRFPATNVVTCFSNHPQLKVRVVFHGDDGSSNSEDINPEEIKHYACEEFNPGNWKGVKVIEVMGPFPEMGDGTVLVDTPGADNANNSVHDLVLLDFLPRIDVVVFLVTADEPLTDAEIELLKCARRNDVRKLVFAINKADRVDSNELAEAIAHNRKVLGSIGYGDAPVIPIAAKAFREHGSDPGTSKLLRVVGDLISGGRTDIVASRLDDLVHRLLLEARESMAEHLRLAELTVDQIRDETKVLGASRQEFECNRGKWEREFVSSWQKAFEDFEIVLDKIEHSMVLDYTALVEKTPSLKLSALAGVIHTEIIVRFDELLEEPLAELNRKLVAASDRMTGDFTKSMRIVPHSVSFPMGNVSPLKGIGDILAAGAPGFVAAAIF